VQLRVWHLWCHPDHTVSGAVYSVQGVGENCVDSAQDASSGLQYMAMQQVCWGEGREAVPFLSLQKTGLKKIR
jgi:hypothetical protein